MIQSFTTNIADGDLEIFYDDENNRVVRANKTEAHELSLEAFIFCDKAIRDYILLKGDKLLDNLSDEEINDDDFNFEELV